MSIWALFLAIMVSWNLKTSLKIDLKKQCHEMCLRENNGDGSTDQQSKQREWSQYSSHSNNHFAIRVIHLKR